MTSSLEIFLSDIRNLIAEGEIESALSQLQNYLSAVDSELNNELTLHTGRYNRFVRDKRRGLISREDFQVEISRLSDNLLEFLKELSKKIHNAPPLMRHSDDLTIPTKNESDDASQKPKVFISYTTEDHTIAKRLYDDLKKEGLTPWLDREDLLPGQNWRQTIPRIIKASSYFLLIISEYSVSRRGYIQKEQKIALELLDEFPSGEIFIIPARIDNTEPVDETLQNLHWADLSNYEQGLKQILKTLKSDKSS